MDAYEVMAVVGEGTYGVVHKAKHRSSGIIVAIKQFKECDVQEQIKKTAIREIRILKQLVHDNVVALFDVFRENNRLFLVFEYVERSLLSDLESCPNGLDKSFVRPLMYQLLQSLAFVHSRSVIHRDIKPENLLLTQHGVLKLCDFGFARAVSGPGAKYTDYVATRWYRAPELLVGATEYDSAVDVWSVGCLLCELLSGRPLFPGNSDLDQITHIAACLGPLPSHLADIFHRNPLYRSSQLPTPTRVDSIARRYPFLSRNTLSLVSACLRYDPAERPSAARLLLHPFFSASFVEHFSHEFAAVIRRDRELRSRYYSVCGATNSSTATLNTLSRSIVTDRAAFERSLPGGSFTGDRPAAETEQPQPQPQPQQQQGAEQHRARREHGDAAPLAEPREAAAPHASRAGEVLRVPSQGTRAAAQPLVPQAALSGEQRRISTMRGAQPPPPPQPQPVPPPLFSVRSNTQRAPAVAPASTPAYGYASFQHWGAAQPGSTGYAPGPVVSQQQRAHRAHQQGYAHAQAPAQQHPAQQRNVQRLHTVSAPPVPVAQGQAPSMASLSQSVAGLQLHPTHPTHPAQPAHVPAARGGPSGLLASNIGIGEGIASVSGRGVRAVGEVAEDIRADADVLAGRGGGGSGGDLSEYGDDFEGEGTQV